MIKEEKHHYVYLTTNLINGKQYIGDRTCKCNPENDKYLGSGRPYFQNAIKEYGKNNFSKQILECFNTREEAFNAQEKYIIQYNTLIPNGYNISPKGGHNVKECWSKESKEKCSNTKKGKIGYWKNKKLSEEHIKHLKENHKGMLGKYHSDDSKLQLSNSMKIKNNGKETEEHKQKIKLSMQNYWAKKKLVH